MKKIALMLTFILSTSWAWADGKIVGKITDAKTGETLIGATVMVMNAGWGAVADMEGNYEMSVPEGTYSVMFQIMGYDKKQVTGVVVKNNEITALSATLTETHSTNLQEVIVKAAYKTENIGALYSMQKKSAVVSSGISADIITRSPDKNTGEVLKRVSGTSIQDNRFVVIRGLNDRYNGTLLNGGAMQSTEPDRKAFSFDIIPSRLIDNIVINKTSSAELTGDFAGGIIQIFTRDVPAQSFFEIGLSAGYNTYSTFNNFQQNDIYGARRFSGTVTENKLPAAFGNNLYDYKSLTEGRQYDAARTLNDNYTLHSYAALPNLGLQAAWGNIIKGKNNRKLGTLLGVTYHNGFETRPDNYRELKSLTSGMDKFSTEQTYKYSSSVAGLANLTYLTNKGKISFKNLINKLYDNTYYDRHGFQISTVQETKMQSTVPMDRIVFNTQLEGDHILNANNVKAKWALNYAQMNAHQDDLRTAYYARSAHYNHGIITADEGQPFYLVDRNSRRMFSNLKDRTVGGQASASLPFVLLGNRQTFKAGYAGTYKTRDYGLRVFQYREGLNAPQGLLIQPAHQLLTAANMGSEGLELIEITAASDFYGVNALTNAAYFMLDNSLGDHIKLNWGLRYEHYTQDLVTRDFSLQNINKKDVFSDLLPSANLSVDIDEDNKLRLSASRTVNRPEFRELAPVMFVDFENNWTLFGNQDLVRANITNIDVKYEWYPAPGEVVSMGGFYKKFSNPIESKLDEQSTFDQMIFTFKNAPSATAYGVEVELRKSLAFLGSSSFLERFIIAANASYIYSQVDVSSVVGSGSMRPLQGQSPYLVNGSVMYNDEKKGWAASVLYNRIGDRIVFVGNNTISNTWEKGRNIMDAQLAKTFLKKKLEIKLTASDVLNNSYLRYWDLDNNNQYTPGTDARFQEYKRGVNFNLGINYRL